MRCIIVVTMILLLTIISGYSTESIGYNHIKLGMSKSEFLKVFSRHYKGSFKINTIMMRLDKIVRGYWLIKKEPSPSIEFDIMVYMTEGLNGKVAKITINERWYSEYSANRKFNNLLQILNRKYGEGTHSPNFKEPMKYVEWEIDKNKKIILQKDIYDFVKLVYTNTIYEDRAVRYYLNKKKEIENQQY